MKIGSLLGLAIAVALVVLVLRWLRGRADQKPGPISRDTQGDNSARGVVIDATATSTDQAESGTDSRAKKDENAGTPWTSFSTTTTTDPKSISASDSGDGDGAGGD